MGKHHSTTLIARQLAVVALHAGKASGLLVAGVCSTVAALARTGGLSQRHGETGSTVQLLWASLGSGKSAKSAALAVLRGTGSSVEAVRAAAEGQGKAQSSTSGAVRRLLGCHVLG